MNDSKTFRTKDIDLAAYLDAAGYSATAGRSEDCDLVEFNFKRSQRLVAFVEAYASGSAPCDAIKLLRSRRQLFRSVRNLGGVA